MVIFCVTLTLQTFLWLVHIAFEWRVSTPKARSESMHWPVSCRTYSCGQKSRWRLRKIDAWCIVMTEAVTLSNLMDIASLVSEIWLATDRQTHTQTGRLLGSILIFSKSSGTLKTKRPQPQKIVHYYLSAFTLMYDGCKTCNSFMCFSVPFKSYCCSAVSFVFTSIGVDISLNAWTLWISELPWQQSLWFSHSGCIRHEAIVMPFALETVVFMFSCKTNPCVYAHS